MTEARRKIFAFLAPHLKDDGWNDVTFRESMDRHLDLYKKELLQSERLDREN